MLVIGDQEQYTAVQKIIIVPQVRISYYGVFQSVIDMDTAAREWQPALSNPGAKSLNFVLSWLKNQ